LVTLSTFSKQGLVDLLEPFEVQAVQSDVEGSDLELSQVLGTLVLHFALQQIRVCRWD
jgi:hypothetical protein